MTSIHCGAPVQGIWACQRRVAQLGDRCWQHRKPDPVAAKAKRQAAFAQMERRVDVTEAKGNFIRAALAHGLASAQTAETYARLVAVMEVSSGK